MYEIITKKKRGEELSREEIERFVLGYARGDIPDYQASALLMAICLRGMSEAESVAMTLAITASGKTVDLSRFSGRSVDKHSTGGVGDKTTLIVAPIVASIGCPVAKMSGRGLGHTGGTIDKLESIPGFKTDLGAEEFLAQVEKIGIAVVGQSEGLAPADKKLYALRDVTATVDSIPLICASVMGKKLASGADNIVLDVKYGSGAFMKTKESATELAELMVRIGKASGRRVSALITSMEEPLGRAIGNSLEVIEAIEVLSGRGPDDLREICTALAREMVSLSRNIGSDEAEREVARVISDGTALSKLCEWVSAQGGDGAAIENTALLPTAKHSYKLLATDEGFIYAMDAEKIGLTASALGAGRQKKEDVIDLSAGIILEKKIDDKLEKGDCIATLYASDERKFGHAEALFRSAITLSNAPAISPALIEKIIR